MSMCKGCIYRHWIVIDGVETSYIGLHKGTNPQKGRWKDGGKGYRPNKKDKKPTKFYKAIQEYGWENFSHEVIGRAEAETMKQLALDLDEWEKYYIEKYDSFYNGFNSTTGGSGGMVMSDETKRKISELRMGKGIGEDNPFYGKQHSKETKRKISESRMGKPLSEETKQKIKDSTKGEKHHMYGKQQKEETKRKISEAKKGHTLTNNHRQILRERWIGQGNPNYAKEFSDKQKQEMSKAQGGQQIICLNTLEVFPSAASANKWAGIKNGVSNCCKGKRPTAGKHPETGEPLKWMYYDEYLKLHN